ncbi:unnamed protein product [Pylaiella littoralis]
MRWLQVLSCIGGLVLPGWSSEEAGFTPQFPEQFSARLQITSHMVDRAKEYPPWNREMDVVYDSVAGRAKVVVRQGLNAGKTFLRLYSSKEEYMIREGAYPACRRSNLGDLMPSPELPRTVSFQGVQMLGGSKCEHWFQDDGVSRIHIFIDSVTQAPRRLTEETLSAGAAAVPLMTYDFLDFKVGPQAPELFVLPEQYVSREACDLHVGGFPYLHLFHHYLRV